VITVELLAAGSFLQFWYPSTPLWLLSLLCAAVIIAINLFPVKYYGELEFWFAGIKIIALVAFIILGAFIIFGILPSNIEEPLANYTAHGGFFPHGVSGMLSAFLVVMFSYGGAELIGVAVTETKDVERVMPSIIKGAVWRVIIFYIFPILIICGIMPWNQVTGQDSPFVQVFTITGLPGAAHVMNFILLTAVLSAANSGIYATSRTLFSMAKSGVAPEGLMKTSRNGIPIIGLMITTLFLLVGVFLAYISPGNIISYLMTIPGFTIMMVWIGICSAHLKLRPQYKVKPTFQVKWFPLTTIIAMVALSLIFIGFVFSPSNLIGSSVSLIIVGLLIVLSFIAKKK
jgi:AAT family amino acid transporter